MTTPTRCPADATPSTVNADALTEAANQYTWLVNHATAAEFKAWCQAHNVKPVTLSITPATVAESKSA